MLPFLLASLGNVCLSGNPAVAAPMVDPPASLAEREVRALLPELIREAIAYTKQTKQVSYAQWMVIWKLQRAVGDQKGAEQTLVAAIQSAESNTAPYNVTDLGRVATSQAAGGDAKGAKRTFDRARHLIAEMKNPHDKSTVLYDFVDQLLITGDIDGATKAVDAFAELDADRLWTKIVEEKIKNGDFTGARKTVEKTREVQGKAILLARVAVVEARAGQAERAKETFALARQVADTLTEARSKAFALQIITDRLATVGYFSEAKRVGGGITIEPYRSNALSAIVNLQKQGGDLAGALESVRNGPDSDPKAGWKTEALSSIVVARLDRHDFDGAKRTAALMTDAPAKADLLRLLAGTEAKAGDVKAARVTAGTIENEPLRNSALLWIAFAQAKSGDVAGVRETATALTNDNTEAGILKKPIQYAIAEAQAQSGDLAGARMTAGAIQDPCSRAYTLCAVAAVQVKAGDLNAAKQTYSRARVASDAIPEPDSQAAALLDIASGLAVAGDLPGAREQFIGGRNAAVRIRPGTPEEMHDKINLLWNIVRGQLSVGDREGAIESTLAMRAPDAEILEADQGSEHWKIISPDDQWYAFTMIIDNQTEKRDFLGAKAAAESIPDMSRRVDSLCTIARKQAATGDLLGSRETFRRVRQLAEVAPETHDISNRLISPHDDVLFHLFQAQVAAGDVMGARRSIADLSETWEKLQAVTHLASAIAEANRQEPSGAAKK